MATEEPAPAAVRQTACCVGGPGGLMLGLLLARKGVPVVVLEAHKDFDRDFRGDTIPPSTLEVLDQIGLADRLLQRPHAQMREMQVRTDGQVYTLAKLSRLR